MVFSVLTISALFHFAKGMPLGEIVRFRRKKKHCHLLQLKVVGCPLGIL